MPSARPCPLSEYPAKRIALIKPSALGDIVHSLPVLTALRQRFPDAYIAWVVNKGYEPLLRGHPDLDATIPFDRAAFRSGLLSGGLKYYQFLKAFRHEVFDLVIDLQGLFRSGLMVRSTGAPRRVGLSTAREGATWFYTDVVRVADFDAIHAVDRYWLVAEALGVGHLSKQFRVPIPPEASRWADEVLDELPRPWIVLGVGSRWVTKRWPPAHFAELAERAREFSGASVVLVGGLEDEELSRATAARLRGPVQDLTGKTSLPQLAAVLSRADLMIANDTGPLHLAAALGRPVVAPYTCTRVLLNGPFGQDSRAVETAVWCGGSYVKHCPRLECMTELTPDRLWPIVRETLRTWENNRRSA